MNDPADLTPEIARQLAESSVAALKPGDVLAVRLPSRVDSRELHMANEYGRKIEERTGVKVAFIPGEEFAHVTLNVTVHVGASDPVRVAEVIRQEIAAQLRNARSGISVLR